MMKSVANQGIQHGESTDDYIIVDQPDEMRDDFSDDESYDYCDDIYSFHSTAQSMSTSSSTSDNIIPSDVIVTDSSVAAEEEFDDTPSNEDAAQITVPSVLMKDLDEAHAAAKLARISDLERSVVSTLSHSKSVDEESRDIAPTKNAPIEPSKKEKSGAMNLSRTSNKRRRKKLKLMKKAQAAANAASALAEKAIADAQGCAAPQKSTKSKTKTPGCRSSKKVANIAVVCATETLSAYRNELLRAKQQCV